MKALAWIVVLGACGSVELLSSPKACVEDASCGANALCVGEVCHPCPSLDGCVVPEPASKWTQLERNGCAVCEFAPAAECYGPSDCDQVCYRGARCATGCARFECCANVCDVAGCPDFPPLGCKADCSPQQPTCTTCVTTLCRCTPQGWDCDVACADLSASCAYVPP